jgi:hypothetical protein
MMAWTQSTITKEQIDRLSSIMACQLAIQSQGWEWERPMRQHLMPGEYRNPFHFLNEFDQWFEFESRKRFEKEPTWSILSDMLRDDLGRAARYEIIERFATVRFDPEPIMLDPRAIFIKGDFS